MLVIGRIEYARGEQHYRGVARGARRRHRFQRGQELVRIILDRRDPVPGEQIRKQAEHDLAVLQHVGDAGRGAGIVLEHVKRFGVDPDDIDPGDEHVEIVRHFLAVHLRAKQRIAEDQILRDDSGAQDLPLRIDVLEEQVERAHALLQPAGKHAPFRAG